MKKRQTHFVIGSKMAIAATMIASPLVAAPDASPTPKPKADASASQKNAIKDHNQTTIVGKDSKGRVIRKNERGETFYLEAGSGKMVFVKWPEAKPQPSPKK
jgi:hypothetical protein